VDKTIAGNQITYLQARRALLPLVVMLPAALIIGRVLEFHLTWVMLLVLSLMSVSGIVFGLTSEKLTLDLATRSGVFETVFSGVKSSSKRFTFTDVVGCLVLDTVTRDYEQGRAQSGLSVCYTYILYREQSGKVAAQIKAGTFDTKEAAMAEATETIQSIGGKIYFKEDLERLLA
jgi:hypothetical protein